MKLSDICAAIALAIVLVCVTEYVRNHNETDTKAYTDCASRHMAVNQTMNQCMRDGGESGRCYQMAVAKHCKVVEL